MSRTRSLTLTVLSLVVLSAFGGQALGQERPRSQVVQDSVPTVEQVEAVRGLVASDTAIDEALRTELDGQLVEAIGDLQAAARADGRIAALIQELENAPQQLEELQVRLTAALPSRPGDDLAAAMDLDARMVQLSESEGALGLARQRLEEIEAEVDYRAKRRPKIAELVLAARDQAAAIAQQLDRPVGGEVPARVTEARRISLRCEQHRLRSELALLDQESRTFEGSTRYWSAQRDLAERDLREQERIVQFWNERVAEARRVQAEADAREATRALVQSQPAVRAEAARNTALAEENTGLVTARQQSRTDLDRVRQQLDRRVAAYDALRRRAEAAGFSPAIGALLRAERSALPDLDQLRRSIDSRQDDIGALNLQLIEWESERKPLVDLREAIAVTMNGLTAPSIPVEDLEEQVHTILAARLKLLGELMENGTGQLDQLVRLYDLEKQLLSKVKAEGGWIAEHVLWVRSTRTIGMQAGAFFASFKTLFSVDRWTEIGRAMLADFYAQPLWWWSLIIAFLALIGFRRPLKRRIRRHGESASRATCTRLWPTVESLLMTALVAVPLPLLLTGIGMRLARIVDVSGQAQALSGALLVTAGTWAVLEFVRQLARPGGVGEAHFEWYPGATAVVRRVVQVSGLFLLPALAIVAYSELLQDHELASTVGRLAFLVAMATADWSMFQLLRPSSPIIRSFGTAHPASVLWRARWLWIGILLSGPVFLAVLSALGYHYTAIQFAGRFVGTIGVGLASLLAISLASRWLLMTYRRLAIQHRRERREKMLQATEADSDQLLQPEIEPELRLSDINQQARRLLRLGALAAIIVAVYFIWIDVLPAFGVLRSMELWPSSIATTATDQVQWVTAADLFVALLITALTVVASRNLPGLVEIAVLQYLPFDAGSRYAISTVTRYIIVVTGVLLGFRAIGIGWSSVQWLVAAISVGLGFGLQEIFANFVSGIILLFERPARIGDTVTIGTTTGTVTRIQIRATTILDWDNREFIVPNRQFVTGELVNWTLSNPTLRMILKVGIAYGSDTQLATRLLYQVADENPEVLDEPDPFVAFSAFGESSLEFEVRLFVSGLTHYRRLMHELNSEIDRLFREHHITIAFPQRDLHLVSMPEEMLGRGGRGPRTAGDSPTDPS